MQHSHPSSRTGIGQCARRFISTESTKPCIIAGVTFDDIPGFHHQTDGDVVYGAICDAISTLSHTLIMCTVVPELFAKEGISDSEIFLQLAKDSLQDMRITYVSLSLEGKTPQFGPHMREMRENIARILDLSIEQVGMTAIYGDGLSSYSVGEGVKCLAVVTAEKK